MIILLSFAGIFIHSQPGSTVCKKSDSLDSVLAAINHWHSHENIYLGTSVIGELDLDDYLYRTYSNGRGPLTLYIGYYCSIKKIGSSHSPLVCLPGQGWTFSKPEKIHVKIGEDILMVESLTAAIGGRKELFMYWYQAYDRSFSGTFSQKIYTLVSKLKHKREDNAFIRITIPLNNLSKEDAFAYGKQFIQAFYPQFLNYMKESIG